MGGALASALAVSSTFALCVPRRNSPPLHSLGLLWTFDLPSFWWWRWSMRLWRPPQRRVCWIEPCFWSWISEWGVYVAKASPVGRIGLPSLPYLGIKTISWHKFGCIFGLSKFMIIYREGSILRFEFLRNLKVVEERRIYDIKDSLYFLIHNFSGRNYIPLWSYL